MIEKSFAILFFLRKAKGYIKGEIPIVLRITVNNVRKEISTNYSCEPDRWNNQAQRVKGTTEKIRTINAYLDSLERKVHEARLKILDTDKPVSVDAIMQILTGQEEKSIMLLDVFRDHNSKMSALEDIEYSPGTVERYATTLSHTQKFIEWKYNQSDIEIKNLSFDFVSDMEFWLKSVRKCNHNSTIKYIANLRKIINICLKSGWLQRDPFYGFKMTKREVVREFLNEDDLQALTAKEFTIERLGQVRDVFLFSCYTGLAFIDAFQLTYSNISTIGIRKCLKFIQNQNIQRPYRSSRK